MTTNDAADGTPRLPGSTNRHRAAEPLGDPATGTPEEHEQGNEGESRAHTTPGGHRHTPDSTERGADRSGSGQESGTRASEAGPDPASPEAPPEVALRGPAELADALPYLLGFHPEDSLVVIALEGPRARFGGRIRIGIPADRAEWKPLAEQVAATVQELGGPGRKKPGEAVLYLCRDPDPACSAEEVVEELRPLAQHVRTACGSRGVAVREALCVSERRVWSYCCPDPSSCLSEGRRIAAAGTSVMAAAAAYAGLQIPGRQREMERRLAAMEEPLARVQLRVLGVVAGEFVPRLLTGGEEAAEAGRTVLRTVGRLIERLRRNPPSPEADDAGADAHDDGLLRPYEAAVVIIGMQDRRIRDRAAEWVEAADAAPALRLWRALARRCVGPFREHAAAPLTLAGLVAWADGDQATARVAIGCALRADPEYLFAKLLHRACNDGLDPELLRRCIRRERAEREAEGAAVRDQGPTS